MDILKDYIKKKFGIDENKFLDVLNSANRFFKEKMSLWLLIGREVLDKSITQYLERLNQVPFIELKELAKRADISCNFNYINDLWSESLMQLNAYIVHFFPPEYQLLDFSAMQERF